MSKFDVSESKGSSFSSSSSSAEFKPRFSTYLNPSPLLAPLESKIGWSREEKSFRQQLFNPDSLSTLSEEHYRSHEGTPDDRSILKHRGLVSQPPHSLDHKKQVITRHETELRLQAFADQQPRLSFSDGSTSFDLPNESLGSKDDLTMMIEDAAQSVQDQRVEELNDELRGVYDQYFGEAAILDFHQKFKSAMLNIERYPVDSELPDDLRTPRSLYLRGTTKAQLLPLPLILRKESEPLGLHLRYRGIGDERFAPVVNIIEKLPALQSIDLTDNRLTDDTLMTFATKLQQLKALTHLDLSYNKIDESSETIMNYLRDDNCQLKTLLLNGADVDDGECVNLATAIKHNRSIQTLSLAKNLIGNGESLNALRPKVLTGGQALGDMLRTNKTLTKLDLSWNGIRADSALALAKSLEVNDTLKTLLLAYNAFGDMPSQVLGRALKSNKALTELDLESNSINPKAATVLANAISFNETLLKLNINGNTLGKIGAQALVAAIQRSSSEIRKLQVSFINCDCSKEHLNIFNPSNPHGTWRMNLREPYGQMVAAECLYLANYKAGCRIVRMLYNGTPVTLDRSYVATEDDGDEGEQKKFKLDEFFKHSREAAHGILTKNFPEASRALQDILSTFGLHMQDDMSMEVVKKAAELWSLKVKREGRDDLQDVFLYEIFFALFVINDADMSGTMELDEFMETLASLGKPDYDRENLKRLMGEYDRDESGSIDANEFGTIMLNEFCRTEMPRGELVDVTTGLPWEIPQTGHLLIQLSYVCDAPTLYDIGADHGIDNIISSIREAKTDEQRDILFQNTTSSPYFFLSLEQAQMLFDVMQGLNRVPLDLMASILPQVVNDEQAVKFIDNNLNDYGKIALRVKIGPLYNVFVGLPTGHYAFDMKIPAHRNGGRRLGAISVSEAKVTRAQGIVSSQKGNFSNFRNEKFGTANVDVTGKWFASPALQDSMKVLRCDYVSTTRPRKSTQPMSDSRFDRFVEQLNLEEMRNVWDRLTLKDHEHQLKKALETNNQPAVKRLSLKYNMARASISSTTAGITATPSMSSLRAFLKAMTAPTGPPIFQTNSGSPIYLADFPELAVDPPYSVIAATALLHSTHISMWIFNNFPACID